MKNEELEMPTKQKISNDIVFALTLDEQEATVYMCIHQLVMHGQIK